MKDPTFSRHQRRSSSLLLFISVLVVIRFPSTSSFASNKRHKFTILKSASSKQHHLVNSAPDRRLTSASTTNSSILVDVENVRGKSGFALSHGQILDKATIWAKRRNLFGRVTLVVDHGSEPSGYFLRDRGLGVAFAGPNCKADDVITRDVSYFQKELGTDCVVVTADRELMRRCHRASLRSGTARLELVPPANFIEDLDRVVYDRLQEERQQLSLDEQTIGATLATAENEKTIEDEPISDLAAEIEQKMEQEIQLWGQVVDTEIQLKRRGGSQKKKQKLSKQLYSLKEKLARLNGGPSTLEQVTASSSAEGGGGGASAIPRHMQDGLMSRFSFRRKNSLRAERTGDRVVLAELLRRQLEVITGYDGGDNVHEEEDCAEYPAAAHVRYVNVIAGRLFSPSSFSSTGASARSTLATTTAGSSTTESRKAKDDQRYLKPLRLVVISDTHGYETSLTSEGAPPPWDITPDGGSGITAESHDDNRQNESSLLPHGDVLLHLGDFAIDASSKRKKEEALVKFDRWLADQPHAIKIVLRGNHDPFKVPFPASNATYVATPQALEIGGWKISLVPYVTHRRYKVPPGDLLATHIPPKAILDRCESGALAGCSYLRSSVEKMSEGPPKLWVCGHIHESRGLKRTRFNRNFAHETLILNAANANPGIACALIHGPVIAELNQNNDEQGAVFLADDDVPVSEDYDFQLGRSYLDVQVPEGVGQLILSVDLGLRMGASLFNERGQLLRYEQFYFKDADELFHRVPVLFENWESEANLLEDDDIKHWALTHVAIEGGDVTLLDAWRSAVETNDPTALPQGGRGARLHTVRPEEWRSDLLTKKEKASGRKAKEAARLIARQVVNDFGVAQHEGKFKTDVAEAVTLGFHMSRRLGWIESNVRRASNGMVMVPR